MVPPDTRAATANRRPIAGGDGDAVTPPTEVAGGLWPAVSALRRLVEDTSDGILVVDRAGRTQFRNPAAAALLGDDGGDQIRQLLGQRVAGHDFLGPVTRPDGSQRMVEGRVVASTWQRQPAYLVSLRDVTDRCADPTLTAVGLAADGIAHEIRDVFAAILCETDGLATRLAADEVGQQALAHVESAVRRGLELSSRLMHLATRQCAPSAVDLCGLLAAERRELVALLGDGVRLDMELPAEPLLVDLAVPDLELVLRQLVGNACGAMPEGGALRIAAAKARIPGGPQTEAGVGRAFAVLTVADTGRGISVAAQAQLFAAASGAAEANQHPEPDLADVYAIVTRAGGHISVLSEPGRGSTFQVMLPALADALGVTGESQAAPAAPEADGLGLTDRPLTVLLAEDEEDVRSVIAEILFKDHHHVLLAANGQEALERLAEHDCPVDLLITDVRMPLMNGPQLVHHVRAQLPELPVLFVSGYARDELGAGHLENRTAGFLNKPFTRHDLLRAIHTRLRITAAPGQRR